MKTIKIVSLVVLALVFGKKAAYAQTINWSGLNHERRNIVNVNAGFEYATIYGVGYGYQLKTTLPTVLNLEFSQPAGGKMLDDFKTKIGGQIRLYRMNNLHFIAKVHGVFRRFENDYVRQLNFGSDLSAIAGYYKPKWFVAGEFGFDKAIVTHFKHSNVFKENFPGATDGWYEPATGGNFYYGLQTGVSFSRNDVTMKVGRVVEQDFKTQSMVPYYFQIGYNRRF